MRDIHRGRYNEPLSQGIHRGRYNEPAASEIFSDERNHGEYEPDRNGDIYGIRDKARKHMQMIKMAKKNQGNE